MLLKRRSRNKGRALHAGRGLKPAVIPKQKHLFRMLTGLALLLVLGWAANYSYKKLCNCNFFQITDVEIDGNRMTTKKQIAALSGVDIHSNLLAVKVPQVKAVLESLPWVATAEVVRDWPNRLLIRLQEKNPVALLNRDSGLFYLDDQGGIIAPVTPSQELDFPVITGLENYPFNTEPKGHFPEPLVDIFDLLKLANRNNPILPEQSISEIHVAEKGELILYLLDRPFPIFLGSDGKISTRYYRLVKVLKDLYKTHEFSEVSYIRLDYQKNTILVGKYESDRIHRG